MSARSELRLVTCLFVDVVGSTDATVRLGPERMQRLLGDAFAQLSATIAEHGGVVEKYVGDAIFALFGAPTTHADDAVRALRAALACAEVRVDAGTADGQLAVRVGVETGEALVDLGAVADRQRMVVGANVNLAARLQQEAAPGTVLVGPGCREATAGIADLEPIGNLELRGLGTIPAWRLRGVGQAGGAPSVEFVGRSAELATLAEVARRAAAGTSMLALVLGPPGQGKSRLADEALSRAWDGRRIEARCRPGTEADANPPLRQLLAAELGLDGAISPEHISARVASVIGAEASADVASLLAHSAGLALDPRLPALGRIEQQVMIAEAWRRYLAGVATSERGLAIVVEDLHWADPVLLRVIDRVTADVEAPVMVVATARPEFAGTAHLRPGASRVDLELGPLAPDEVARLAGLAAPGGRPNDSRSTAVDPLERAGGNPLFVIELARTGLETTAVPMSLQATISARLDELAAAERDLLQRTSVVGETFTVRDAALLGEREPGDVAAELGRFVHLGFVTPAGSAFRFSHALVHDVAYGRLPVAERMRLHARYATDGLEPTAAESLAHHWWEALKPPDATWVWEASAETLRAHRRSAASAQLEAGRRLEQRSAYDAASEVYVRGVELADEAGLRAAAEAALARTLARQGRGDDAWQHRLSAIDLYTEATGYAPAELYADMLEIATFNWGYFHQLPEDGTVLELIGAGAAQARAEGDRVSLARLIAERAAFTGDLAGTAEIRSLLAAEDAVPFADAAQRMATVELWNGRVNDAISIFATVFDRLIPGGAMINVPEALTWYGLAAFMAGDLDAAAALGERLNAEAAFRSIHTGSHASALVALVAFGRGDWELLARTVDGLRRVADEHPDAAFCLLGAATIGYGAARELIQGMPPRSDLDVTARRFVDDSDPVQAATILLPKAMAGDPTADAGLAGYADGLRLWDRYRVWDVADLMPAIAMAIRGRWDAAEPHLGRLDAFAAGGARLAAAVATAIREMQAEALGGPPASFEELHALGYDGLSQVLRHRPPTTTS